MWDLATAKTMLGVAAADTTQDAAITLVMDGVIKEVEDMLGRGLLLKNVTETFYHVTSLRLYLNRYPIHRVDSPPCRIIHHRVGWVELERGIPFNGTVCVTYVGGFKELPAALERCLYEMVETVWSKVDHTTGLPQGRGGATIVQGSGDVSRISLADFGSISYDVGASIVGADTHAAEKSSLWGWLAPWASTLEIYRSEQSPIQTAFA